MIIRVCIVAFFVISCEGRSQNSTGSTIVEKHQNIVGEYTKNSLHDGLDPVWNLFNQYEWRGRSLKLTNQNCKDDMDIFITNLNERKLWALKMYDASGHYTSPYYFGNVFWQGSLSLCDELRDKDPNNLVPSPFTTNFFIAKIRISNTTDIQGDRILLLGECLPKSCKEADVKILLDQETYHGGTLSVLNVRSIPGEYSVYSDRKSHIVGGFCLIVLLIITLASVVDLTTKRNLCSSDLEVNMSDVKSLHNIRKRKTCMRIILAFSALRNGKRILSVDRIPDDSISCLHGLRFLSIVWIIMVHTFLAAFGIGINRGLRRQTEENFMFQTISNATFSVDTFFFISGLLITLLFLRNNDRRKLPIKQLFSIKILFLDILRLLSMIVYRFLRLTPAYFLVLNVNEIIMKNIHSNSVFSPAIFDHVTCKKYWWRNVLYINNFFPQQEFCMLWSWYLANDSQFYVIASILLIIAVKNAKSFKAVSVTLGILLISSWIATFVIAMKNKYVATVKDPFALFDELYDKPWMRIGPYLIGMIVGWILSLSCLASLVYGLGKDGLVPPASAFYVAFGHTAWGLSIAWITVACCSGYGGCLNSIFSWKLFLPVSRLTYCAYLVHPMMMCFTNFVLDGPIHMHTFFMMVMFFGNLVITFLVAFVISIGFEAPMINILKLAFS
ncbi:nose resistant to fluoxetine protein 6-like isoform X2 [Rhynchophorus ferrugineus]|uniref:nose resistant to fluoxetine protein 6-like isoform X2 n=1 Tax=Rhynchophorus ferrugineus TaxID=354439 RepID=UPI003FCDFC01